MMTSSRFTVCSLALICLTSLGGWVVDGLSVGRGIADITGLISEGALYGYGDPTQDARGMHTRQYSRAFVFDDGNKVAAFVVVEICMISQAVHKGVMEQLEMSLGDTFTEENVMLSATHTHSLPGGYHTFWMYQIATGGFINETYDIVVAGIAQSIVRAYEDLRPGKLLINSGQLWDASASRSPYAYWNNPPEELAEYGDEDTDKTMVLLKMQDAQDADMGMISFFGVHPTSMKNTNHLLSSDNKGYAVIMMEKYLNPGKFPGKGSVLAAFTQTCHGDSTPNLGGDICEGTNEYCAYNTSTCPEAPLDPRLCLGRGPNGDMFEDTRIIGERQYLKAKDLFESASEFLDGPVDYRQQWVNMSGIPVVGEDGFTFTCRPAMGYSFACGATDGPGIPPFTQARLEPIDYVENLTSILFNKSEEHYACHLPKPVLLPTGTIEAPWQWQPEILPLQLLRIGDFVLIGIPAEVTTMSGRRIQKAVKRVLVNNGVPDTVRTLVVNLANSYSSYLTTFEEYQVQRYEGASTIFGQHTLQAYTRIYESLAFALATGTSVDKGPTPPDFRGLQRAALRDIKIDLLPSGYSYGDVLIDVLPAYRQGESANVTFVSGNPRNNLMTDDTFLEVQRRDDVGTEWSVEFVDSQWETKLYWDSACHEGRPGPGSPQNCTLLGQESTTTIVWDIPSDQQEGWYRIRHYGNARRPIGPVVQYVGTSSEFQVVSNDQRKIKSK